ncbi:MAG TPA: DMT family transporter [Bryobacteraceae bacterium]|nr:DMT family transporter [Bryobacteraceae bacterium]
MHIVKSGLLMAIIAHGVIGLSLLWDKVLLKRPATQNLISYVFWMGAMSVFGVILALFGFHWPPLWVAATAFGSGALQMAGIYFYYLALKLGEASEALAVMGGFSPVFTAMIAWPLLGTPLGNHSEAGFALMVLGGFVMFAAERLDFPKLIGPVLAASGIYGVLNVTQKIAFNHSNFVTAYVFFTLGTFAGALFLLIRPSWRRQIFANTGESKKPREHGHSSRFWYFVNRFFNGLGSFLVFYAISLTSPAVVDAITAVRYVVIFIGAYLITTWRPNWLREDFHGWVLAGKAAATALVGAGLVLEGMRGGQTGAGSTAGNPELTPQATQVNKVLICEQSHGFAANVVLRSNSEAVSWLAATRSPGSPLQPGRHTA